MATIDKKIGLVVGATPNLTIGTVTTLEPDASATATITGTAEDPVLNLGIPRGQTGEVTEEEFTQLKEDLSEIIQTNDVLLNLNSWSSGYIKKTGEIATETSCKYAYANITSDLIGKTIYVSGTAWYNVVPFVFVGTSTNIVYADVPSPSGTVTQHTDLEFVPSETGTLYVNKYDTGNTHNVGTAYIKEIASVKSAMLPQPLPLKDITTYTQVSLTMIQAKLLNAATGVITDSDTTSYYVSDYTEVTPNSKVMITTEHFWSRGLWAFYDENKQFLSGQNSNTGGTVTKKYCEIVDVPLNAKYVVIGFYYQNNFKNCFLWQGEIESGLQSKKWNGKKWALLGDSLTAYGEKASMHYFDYIRGVTGISVVNLAVSGTGYAKGTNNFMSQANNVPSDSDVITLFGSFNDLSSGLDIGTVTDTGTNTISGCINTTLDNILTIIPLANIGVIAPTPWETTQPSTSGNAYNYVEMLKAICERRSIPFLDLWRCSNLRPWDSDFLQYAYSNDGGGGVHPDNNGHKLIAPRIKAFLETLLL